MNTSPATLIRRFAIGTLAVGASGALLVTGPNAQAVALPASTVTIQAEGVDLSGTLTSTSEACMDERTVIVFKQKGKRGGGDDVKFASDTSEIQNGVGTWSTGNTGTEGKFYAKVRRTATCLPDFSPTIKAERND
jgi:hypothetical protein